MPLWAKIATFLVLSAVHGRGFASVMNFRDDFGMEIETLLIT